jgi:hypothetical protein
MKESPKKWSERTFPKFSKLTKRLQQQLKNAYSKKKKKAESW